GMMSFLAPFLVYAGLAAAAIPIALHFFFRSRYRRVPWAAMKFLLTSVEQTSRRLKFQELLLLLARVALLVLLGLALARPTTFLAQDLGRGDAVDAVLVLDTSYSMDARDGPATRLERARSAALAVLDHLPPQSTVQVIASSNRAELLGPRVPSDLDQARQLIQSLEVSHLATDLLPAIAESASALQHGPSPNKELYLFSDMQKLGWDQQADLVRDKLQDISRKATVYLVRCGTGMPKNVSVAGIIPQEGLMHAGERAGFAVLVRNSGTEPLRNLTVTLAVDGHEDEKEAQPIPELGAGETRAVPLTGKWEHPGLRVITATVRPDELAADNRFDQVIQVRDQVRILVVDGSPDPQEPAKAGSFHLMHALLPVPEEARATYHIQPRLVGPGQAYPGLLDDKDLCILTGVALPPAKDGTETLSQEFVDQLAAFVRAGHGLLIFGGAGVSPEPYNRLLGRQHGLLPLDLEAAQDSPAQKPFRLDRNSADSTLAAFRMEEYKALNRVVVQRRLGVQEPEGNGQEPGRVLLRYDDGRPAVVARQVGAGEVLLVTTSADPSWTNWPREAGDTYLPFVHLAVHHLLDRQAQNFNQVAGQPLRYTPSERDAARPFLVVRPDGQQVHLGPPEMIQGRPVVTAPDTSQAGIYHLAPANKPASEATKEEQAGVPFAVVPDPRETEDLASLSDEQLDQRLGFRPIHRMAGEEATAFTGTERQHREWTLWMLAAVLGVALGETGLAWLCGRAW
ncbi:MAG: VWA domain-containing protein, partial [Planctomycetes bacterium]|nr:VWA domain-containing protein [Planctomycetota bacterium]